MAVGGRGWQAYSYARCSQFHLATWTVAASPGPSPRLALPMRRPVGPLGILGAVLLAC
jgi:hypothetical protein